MAYDIQRLKQTIKVILFLTFMVSLSFQCRASSPKVAYDIDEAIEICSSIPLELPEGIWLYPEDNVTVMILSDEPDLNSHTLPEYTISVVETSDARLLPGEIIGKLKATPDNKTYAIELATEKKNDLLLKPKSCSATLSSEGETLIIKKSKTGLKGRFSLNFNRLLPGFWKIVSTGVSTNGTNGSVSIPVGMVKIFPSYDGNGSSRRKIRYL